MKMATNGTTRQNLETHIAAALTANVGSAVLIELIEEAEQGAQGAAATAVAERHKAVDLTACCDLDQAHQNISRAELKRDRLQTVLPRLRDKLASALDQERRAAWAADRDRVKARRDVGVERYRKLPQLIEEIRSTLQEAADIDAACQRLNTAAPPNVSGHLLGVELTARNMTQFSTVTPSWAETIRLPGDSEGRPAWPPYVPIDPGMIVKDTLDPRYNSGEWWKVVAERDAKALTDGERAANYYDEQHRLTEERENVATRQRVNEARAARIGR